MHSQKGGKRDSPLKRERKCENSSVGRAQPCQGWGRGFESRFSLKKTKTEFFNRQNAKIAQLVEHNLAKVGVAGSSPVFRSTPNATRVGRESSPDGGIGRRATLRG